MKTATAPLPPLRSVRFWTSCVSAYATCITAYQPNRLMSTGFVPSSVSTVCVTRQPWAAAKSRHFCPGWRTSARFRSPRIVRHWRPCCSSTARCCTGSALAWEIGRPRPSRRLPVVLTPDEVVRILGFWKASIVCSPSFCMERACGSVRVCNCGSRIWISITARSSCGRAKSSKDRALMLPESLAPSLREQLSRARAWWLKDRAEGRSGVALPDALERRVSARRAFLAVVLGFCAAHAFDRSTERCRASPSHV